jgi:organic radical activating enzyme
VRSSTIVTPKLRISELFLSLQGEGPSAGTPAHFLRLQGCDVGCSWCDTKYSWDASAGREIELDDLWVQAKVLGEAPLLVITGGEPLQHPALAAVLEAALARWPRVEVETSGIAPPPRAHPRLYYNVSPKMPSATLRAAETWAHTRAWLAEPHATFKIVVADDGDLGQFLSWQREHAVPASRIMLMPEGMTAEVLRERGTWLASFCLAHGLRMSPRLHVWLWGARRGV